MTGTLHYDCFAGISGDMHLGAMLNLGVNPDYLLQELKKLKIGHYEIKIKPDLRRGISGTRVDVIIDEPVKSVLVMQNHDHHEHRSFADIKKLIEESELSEYVKDKSAAIFKKLAEAEGKIHNMPVDSVHFHEVGAVDSIVDIVGAAICLDYLKPQKITASVVELGSGIVKCAHGTFPVPAPATLEILKGIPVKSGLIPFEATTPTGAAILATVVDEFITKNSFVVTKTAYGIGHKDSEVPNVLRVLWCNEIQTDFKTEEASVIDCNIDDMNPEFYDFIMDKLFSEGADDVYITPIIMKKSRPAVTLSLMCKPQNTSRLIEILLQHTSSLGVRTYEVTKHMLEREMLELNTKFGKVRVKRAWGNNVPYKYKPEYVDCNRIARESNITVLEVIIEVNKQIANL